MFSHQQSLRKSLMEEKDAAMALHIILVLLFQQETGAIIHIPGKFIPTMISFLCQHLPRKEHEKLVRCQHLITAKWRTRLTPDSEETQRSETRHASSITAADVSSEDDEIDTLIQDLKQLVIRVNA